MSDPDGLYPCPACQGTDLRLAVRSEWGKLVCRVICRECHAQGPAVDVDARNARKFRQAPVDAIEKWNDLERRKADDPMAKLAVNSTLPASVLAVAIYDTHGNVYSPSAKAMVPPNGTPATPTNPAVPAPTDTLMPMTQAPATQAPGQVYWVDNNFPNVVGSGYFANVIHTTDGSIFNGPISVSPEELYAPGNTVVFTLGLR